jgi:sec-independent protein translocase protein TatA
MGSIGPGEIVLLLVLALLLFGAKRLPEIGRSLGHGMREFKDSVSGHDGLSSAMSFEQPEPPPPVPAPLPPPVPVPDVPEAD